MDPRDVITPLRALSANWSVRLKYHRKAERKAGRQNSALIAHTNGGAANAIGLCNKELRRIINSLTRKP